MIKLHTVARDGQLYNATAQFDGTNTTVLKGSTINLLHGNGFKPSNEVAAMLKDKSLYDEIGRLLKDVSFSTLSTAASFVTGRVANGMICWKTEDNKYVRYTLQDEK